MSEATLVPCLHRVDPRLVHATLLEAWIPHLEAERLVVADAATAQDHRRRTIVEMAARDVSHIDIVDEVRVAEVLDGIDEPVPTIVVYPGLEAFSRALEAGLECRRVHVGHLPAGDGRKRVHPSVFVGPEELEWVDRIEAMGVEVVVRPLPTDQTLALRRGEDERPVLTDDLPPTLESGPIPAIEVEAAPDLPPPVAVPLAGARSGRVMVVNERGLHLRAAHLLAQRAGRYGASVEVGWPGRMVNAKSLLGITTLGAGKGTELELHVEGPDAQDAYNAIESLFEVGFEEGSE